jgi:hypothetical protein
VSDRRWCAPRDPDSSHRLCSSRFRSPSGANWVGLERKAGFEYSGTTNSAREATAKNVSNAVEKHVSKASAKRDVQVNTSYESKAETGEQQSVTRELANINVGRTLNFVFRQMNQEFLTLLHLVDVRVAFFNGDPVATREVTLPQLASLLDQVIVEPRSPSADPGAPANAQATVDEHERRSLKRLASERRGGELAERALRADPRDCSQPSRPRVRLAEQYRGDRLARRLARQCQGQRRGSRTACQSADGDQRSADALVGEPARRRVCRRPTRAGEGSETQRECAHRPGTCRTTNCER